MPTTTNPPLWHRVAWFLALWLGGVAAVTVVSAILHIVLKA